MFRYRVRYRRSETASRIYHVTVTARDADEARAYAKLRDPLFHSTVESPRRGAVVVSIEDGALLSELIRKHQQGELEDDDCWHDVVQDQERIDSIFFGVCAECHEVVAATGPEDDQGEPGWELAETEFTTFRGVKVEVTG